MSFNSETHRSLRKLKFMGVSVPSALCSCSHLHPQTNLTSLPISLNNSYLIYPVYLLGEGNGNPLQSSCLENPVDRGAWWAALHGVTQNQMQLKRFCMHACMDGRRNWQPTPAYLAWRIPGTEELGWLLSMGSHRVGHN